MFTHSPMFIRFQRYGQQFTGNTVGGAWWLLMAPGIALTLVALAILVWPELLAYMAPGRTPCASRYGHDASGPVVRMRCGITVSMQTGVPRRSSP
jgi:hypothetical protein